MGVVVPLKRLPEKPEPFGIVDVDGGGPASAALRSIVLGTLLTVLLICAQCIAVVLAILILNKMGAL